MSTLEEPPAPPPKTEDADEDSFSDSSHEFDGPEGYPPETAQVQKRKGGRKPVRRNIYPLPSIAHLSLDIRNFRGEKAAEPPSPGRLP